MSDWVVPNPLALHYELKRYHRLQHEFWFWRVEPVTRPVVHATWSLQHYLWLKPRLLFELIPNYYVRLFLPLVISRVPQPTIYLILCLFSALLLVGLVLTALWHSPNRLQLADVLSLRVPLIRLLPAAPALRFHPISVLKGHLHGKPDLPLEPIVQGQRL